MKGYFDSTVLTAVWSQQTETQGQDEAQKAASQRCPEGAGQSTFPKEDQRQSVQFTDFTWWAVLMTCACRWECVGHGRQARRGAPTFAHTCGYAQLR